jgi:hypothetical protein
VGVSEQIWLLAQIGPPGPAHLQMPSTGSQVVPFWHIGCPKQALPARHERWLASQTPPSLPAGQAHASPLWHTTPLHLQSPSALSQTLEPVHVTPRHAVVVQTRAPPAGATLQA